MTARAFADTNILIYAQGSDVLRAQRAIEIIERLPVISTQVINETCSPKVG
jgi:predicted nucleic acid-binding protein